jgi:hypothetical protein
MPKQLILISRTSKKHGRNQYVLSEKGKARGSQTLHITEAEATKLRKEIKEKNNAEQLTSESQ